MCRDKQVKCTAASEHEVGLLLRSSRNILSTHPDEQPAAQGEWAGKNNALATISFKRRSHDGKDAEHHFLITSYPQ